MSVRLSHYRLCRHPGIGRSEPSFCLAWPLKIPVNCSTLMIQGRNNRLFPQCACTERRNHPWWRRIAHPFGEKIYGNKTRDTKRQQARQEVEVVTRKKFDHGEIKFPLEFEIDIVFKETT